MSTGEGYGQGRLLRQMSDEGMVDVVYVVDEEVVMKESLQD